MDKSYLTAAIAEALGNEYGVIETEHRLMDDARLDQIVRRQIQEIYDEDEQHAHNLEQILDLVGRTSTTEESVSRGREACLRLVGIGGDDPIEVIKGTILAKYRSADAGEMFYELCDEFGHEDACGLFETNLEEEEDHLDYLREQAMLMTRQRITGEKIAQ